MESISCDLAVIGSGPGGQKAAIQAAKLGKSVVVIEQYKHPGGSCLNWGTIPSKSLREAILDLTRFYQRNFDKTSKKEITISDLNERLNRVLNDQRQCLLRQFERNGVRLLHGFAKFVDSCVLVVMDDHEEIATIDAKNIVIATGSSPRNPEGIPFDTETVLDSTRLLQIEKVPKSLLVMGGGIIGSEYASFFAALGTEVTVVDKGAHMLPLLDREMGTLLQQSLSENGLTFVGEKEFASVAKKDGQVYVSFQDGSTLQAEMFLFALGRVANVSGMGIENCGLELDERGYIPVNALFQTSMPHVYAVGDVIGAPSLASTSMEQGRLASLHAFGQKTHHFPTVFPIGIYTIPEISSVGYTEEQLKELGFKYEVGRAYYYEIARNQIAGGESGMFKILFHSDTLEILGIQIIGREATEVIHIGQVAMNFHASIDYFIDQVFNYPTYAEGYRIAALNGYNKIQYQR
ncbi:MAG: Si-specific NAD(P)(+) transhydrogenase [Simkaniaceae bacterium]|nr:Si-specific NAD(P)(+) transhydrogenase [Simkaniaceae bacterium]